MARSTLLVFALAALAATAAAAPADTASAPIAPADVPPPTVPAPTDIAMPAFLKNRRLMQTEPVVAGVGTGLSSGLATTLSSGSIVQGVASGVSDGLQTGVYTAVTGYTPWQKDGQWHCGPAGVDCWWNVEKQMCMCNTPANKQSFAMGY